MDAVVNAKRAMARRANTSGAVTAGTGVDDLRRRRTGGVDEMPQMTSSRLRRPTTAAVRILAARLMSPPPLLLRLRLEDASSTRTSCSSVSRAISANNYISDSESSSYESVEVADEDDVAAKVNAKNEPAVAAPAASAPAPAKAAANDNDDDKPAPAGGGDVKGDDDDANDDDEPEGDNEKSAAPPQWTTVGKGAEAASGNIMPALSARRADGTSEEGLLEYINTSDRHITWRVFCGDQVLRYMG